MRIEKMETIYLTQEEDTILGKVHELLGEINTKTEDENIQTITECIINYLYDLNQYIEEE